MRVGNTAGDLAARSHLPKISRHLLAATALTGATLAAAPSAWAQCAVNGSAGAMTTVSCSGAFATTNTTNTSDNAASIDRTQQFANDIQGSNSGVITGEGLYLSSTAGSVSYTGSGSVTGSGTALQLAGATGVTIGTLGTPATGNFTGLNGIFANTTSGAGGIGVYLNGGAIAVTTNGGNGLLLQSASGNINAVLGGNTTITQAPGSTGIYGINAQATTGNVTVSSDANMGANASGERLTRGINVVSGRTAPAAIGGNVSVTQTGGSIFTDGDGVFARTIGGGNVSVTQAAGAVIDAGNRGIYVNPTSAGTATVDVAGSVTAAGDTIFFQTGASKTLNNTGTITSGNFAVYGVNNLSVTNAGTISGAIRLDGSGNTLTLATTSTIIGQVRAGGTDALRLGGSSGNGTFDASQLTSATGTLLQYEGFSSLTKVDTSTWTVTGTSPFTGTVAVNAGTMFVNGDLSSSSSTTISGGTLGGSGTVSATTVNSGGTLAPGNNSIGTLNVGGNVTFNAGSTYAIEVSPSAADRTIATGSAILTGGTVQATYQAGSYLTRQYTILTANGGRGGTQFAGLTNNGIPAGVTASLSYDANNAYLDLTAPAASGLPGNQQGPANAISNFFNNGGALPPGFVTLVGLTGAQQQQGYAQVSGESSAAGPTMSAYASSNTFINAMIDPSIDGRGGDGGASAFADETATYASSKLRREVHEAYAAVTPRDKANAMRNDAVAARWSVWASGYGGTSNVDGNSTQGTSNTSARIYGTVIGADYRLTRDTLVGFALGGAGTTFNTANLGSGSADLFQIGAYGRHNFGSAYVSGALAYGWQDVTTERTVTVAGTDRLQGRFDAQTFAARGEAGYRFAFPFAGVTPYGALQFTSVHLPAYAESATSGSSQFAVAFASNTTDNLRSELGLRADKSFLVAEGIFTMRGRLAWAHDSSTDRIATPTFQALPGSQSFTVNGARPAANGALLSAGAEMKWRNGWSVAAVYEGEFSRTTDSHAGKGTLRYAF